MPVSQKLKLNLTAFKRLIKENSDTVFILQRVNYHILAPLLVSLLKKNKVVFDCDDWNIRENPKYYFGFPSSKMEYVYRKLAGRSCFCVAASRFLEKYLGGYSKKVIYLPTGVDTDSFYPQDKKEEGKIIFSWTGTVYHQPMLENLEFILSCFRELSDEFKNIFLYLAGQGKYYEEFKRIACQGGSLSRVKIFPWISPDEMPRFLSGIDIGLLPLIQESYFNKAKSPTKLFEYMAMEKPVVASPTGEAQNIIIDGNGMLAASRGEFISKMRMLILDKQLRYDMGKRARKSVESKYSLDVLGKELYLALKGIS
jgi:glycosyltransferase involved in cell wall biosynthesis